MLINMKESIGGLWQDACNFVGQAKHKVAAVGTGATLLAGNAMAAVPTEVSDALGTAKTDSASVAGLVLVAIVAIFGFALMRKALR